MEKNALYEPRIRKMLRKILNFVIIIISLLLVLPICMIEDVTNEHLQTGHYNEESYLQIETSRNLNIAMIKSGDSVMLEPNHEGSFKCRNKIVSNHSI